MSLFFFFPVRWNGVLLAYGNLKLLQSSGAIVDDSPFIYFDVELEAVIFKPSIGSILKVRKICQK